MAFEFFAIIIILSLMAFVIVMTIISITQSPDQEHPPVEEQPNGGGNGTSGSGGRPFDMRCDTIIVGGGIGGIYAAYRLAINDQKSCVFEESNRFGGKLHSVQVNGYWSDIGGKRINEDQPGMLALAEELGVEMTTGNYAPYQMMYHRGQRYKDTEIDELRLVAYPTVEEMPDGWGSILDPANEHLFDQYKDIFTYSQQVVNASNPEAFKLVQDSFRFTGDWEGNDARRYVEFVNQDPSSDVNHYPSRGMEELVKKMIDRMNTMGKTRFYVSEGAIKVDRMQGGNPQRYIVTTKSGRKVLTNGVIFAVPPLSIKKIGGVIGNMVGQHRVVSELKPMKVVAINQRYAESWWNQFPHKRIWTSTNCIGNAEFPITPLQEESKTFRAVYADGYCAYFWEHLTKTMTSGEIARVIQLYFQQFFPDINVPLASETIVKVWDDAWHFEYPGSIYSGIQKEEWASRPIQTDPRIVVVGEAYHSRRTWSEGSVLSANSALFSGFGIEPPLLPLTPSELSDRRRSIVRKNSQR